MHIDIAILVSNYVSLLICLYDKRLGLQQCAGKINSDVKIMNTDKL